MPKVCRYCNHLIFHDELDDHRECIADFLEEKIERDAWIRRMIEKIMSDIEGAKNNADDFHQEWERHLRRMAHLDDRLAVVEEEVGL